jgi:flagellar L-ring protein precursor FlgH
MNGIVKILLTVLALVLASGCATVPPPRQQVYQPTPPVVPEYREPANGAIFQTGREVRLFEDIKARRIGDVITVILQESTAASKSASTTTDRATSVDVASPTILGAVPTFNAPGFLPLDSNRDNTLEAALDSSNTFEGQGDSNQSNSLSGSITVTVADVLSNGNLVVRGEKWLTLNQGEEFVRISGIVRPQDISTANTVFSAQVADARITYSGEGMIANANRPGWLARFFNSSWWPF